MTGIYRRIVLVWLMHVVVIYAQENGAADSVAGNERVQEFIRNFGDRGVMSDETLPTPPKEAAERFELPDGFEIDLVAGEPDVSQPLFLTWDSRGRMWVVQYRQYQFPAGLKVVRYDQHLRAVFDKVPEPPPQGTPGADIISVFEDTDGDGLYDSKKDVITGLNIASSVQVGHGGIWVLNPPYLLFYPDANRDDVPDGDPEVHLSGFGLQDTHAIANSLTWGPDGWLYGANGSTTVGSVSSAVTKGIQFQGQCIWRYHPDTRIFEIYAEGGGNTFSLEIDAKGRVFSGTNGGGTRGFYYPQGSYSQKSWGKHGPLTNPYAFGFFRQMDSKGDDRRFAQAFLIYEGGLFSERMAGDIIAPNSLHNLVWHSRRIPQGSTYRTVDLQNLIDSPDRWFRPVYAGVGPDGAVYLADWYDTRLSHGSPIDDWHKQSGRIYRIRPDGRHPAYQEGNLHELPSRELIQQFNHSNKWVRRRAVLELGWRGDRSVAAELVRRVDNLGSLEAVWALNLLDELTSERAVRWLHHSDPHIRRWVVRLLGDRREGVVELARLAQREGNVQVRSQLASAAKRLSAEFGLPIVRQLLARDEDLADPHMTLMNWWALEAHAEAWPRIEAMFGDTAIWKLPMVRQEIAARMMQRYASNGSPLDLKHAARLIELAPDASSRAVLLVGLSRAYQGRSLPELPESLSRALDDYREQLGQSGLVLALRQRSTDSVAAAIDVLRDSSADLGIRIELVRTFGEIKRQGALSTLIRLATGRDTQEAALQRVAIRALATYDDDSIPSNLIRAFGRDISEEHDLRDTACRTLATRASWSKALLKEVTGWRLRPQDVPADVIQQLRTYQQPDIVAMVDDAFGKPTIVSSAQKLEQILRIRRVLAQETGNVLAGKIHFVERCAKCHKLFGEGSSVGPPLDAYDRGNSDFWLPAIIEPGLEIREGYQSYVAATVDGRVITGMIAAQDPNTVTMRNADNQLTVISRDSLEELAALSTSLMPEDGLKGLTDEQIRDLFAYLSQGAKR